MNAYLRKGAAVHRSFYKLISLISVLLIFLMLPGCSAEKEQKQYKFGATYMQMNNPYFEDMNAHIEELVEANGDILICRDPSQNQDKQNEQIIDMINEGVDAIFINPVNWETVRPALIECDKAGIPLFCIDTLVKDDEYVAFSILSDNYDAGVQCAKDMMSKLDSARIITVVSPGTKSIDDRMQGFEDTIKGHESFEIVKTVVGGGELEVSMDVMNEVVASGLDFDVVIGGNDPSALGVLASLQMNQMQDEGILIYGIDGSPDGKVMINEGYLEGSSAQRPIIMADRAVEMAYAYLAGEEVEKLVLVPVTIITKDNIDQFDIAGWQ